MKFAPIIAGYHWFTDWGRDTMISLEGLTLTTGRSLEAGYILRTFAYYIRDGLDSEHVPGCRQRREIHTADATLWFFHALDRYLDITHDRSTLRLLLPALIDIIEHHLRGTRFNIHVDPEDGLLAQGEEGYQLTWMDAKMGDWVVTPRRGKAVEINALWYNALASDGGMDAGSRRRGRRATLRGTSRAHTRRRLISAFGSPMAVICTMWSIATVEKQTHDRSCRPNQIFAISLDHPVLEQEHWASVVDVVHNKLVTPVGLRSLSPDDPEYKPIYSGDLRSRDGAYHQGTVWAWLIGPFIDAWLRVHPGENKAARQFLEFFPEHLNEAGVGTIGEVFDARAPHAAGGCIAQAWSVAEVLRCWVKTA